MFRRFLLPVVALALALAGAGVARADVQVLRSADIAYLDDLAGAGYESGRLPDEVLVEVDGSQSRCFLEEEAAVWWRQLIDAADADGVSIEAGWCYRDLGSQRSTYVRNCGSLGAPQSSCRVATATPGKSNHGWGRAVDVTSGGRQLGCRSEAFSWLADHGAEYGWVLPFWAACGGDTPEPWHWEWGGIEIIASPVFPIGMRPI